MPGRFNQNRANLYMVFAPPKPVAAGVTALANDVKQQRKLKGRLRREETFHVTLVTLPFRLEAPPEPTDRMIVAIGAVLSQMQFEPIEISFDRVESFGDGARRPIVLTSSQRNKALFDLEGRLREKLHIPTMPGLFKPHLTMIWDRVSIPKLKLGEPVRWIAEKPSLIFSHVGKSKYDWLWPEVRLSE